MNGEAMDVHFTFPWILTLIAAVWLGGIAWRAGRSWLAWAVGAALVTCALTTIVFGLVHAAAIPFSEHGEVVLDVVTGLVLGLIVAIVAGGITWKLLKPPAKTI